MADSQANDEYPDFSDFNHDKRDFTLVSLMKLAYSGAINVPLIVSVGGFIYSGKIVNPLEFMNYLDDSLNNAVTKQFNVSSQKVIFSQMGLVDFEIESHNYLNLENVRVLPVATGNKIDDLIIPFLRIKLEDISAWSLGKIS